MRATPMHVYVMVIKVRPNAQQPSASKRLADCSSFVSWTVTPCPATSTATITTVVNAPGVTVTDVQAVSVTSTRTFFSVNTVARTSTVFNTSTKSDVTTTIKSASTVTFTSTLTRIATVSLSSDVSSTGPPPSALLSPLSLKRGIAASRPVTCPATSSASSVPPYASACHGLLQYSSACICAGAVGKATTLPTPTTTKTLIRTSTLATTTRVRATTTVTSLVTTTVQSSLELNSVVTITITVTSTTMATVTSSEPPSTVVQTVEATTTSTRSREFICFVNSQLVAYMPVNGTVSLYVPGPFDTVFSLVDNRYLYSVFGGGYLSVPGNGDDRIVIGGDSAPESNRLSCVLENDPPSGRMFCSSTNNTRNVFTKCPYNNDLSLLHLSLTVEPGCEPVTWQCSST
ncbi:hypothetical protein JX266_010101 [Neoarthrinium moseri]|nr:hypothetical protein JX266_010101 [Neoarthrinium moseri]